MRTTRRLRNLVAHLRQVATDERIRSASAGYGRLDYPDAEIHLQLTSRSEYHRLRSCAKEPWTVRWIEEHVKPGDVLYDVGANVGVYTLLAAVAVPGSRVVAFEPAPANFAALCANLDLNEVAERSIAVPLALGDRAGAAFIDRDGSVPGASVSLHGTEREQAITVLVDRLDEVVERYGLPRPDHLKLDVDGSELDVLAGGREVLSSTQLRSAMVELESGQANEVIAELEGLGLALVERATGGERPRNAPSYGLFARL
jgi:FkbM family methyltransferase